MRESFQNHVGINITTSKLQVVEVSYLNGEFILENVNEEYFSEFLDFNSKKTKIISLLQRAFNEMALDRTLKTRYYSFTLPHNLFKMVQLPIENSLLDSDLVEHFRWEYSVLFPDLKQEELLLQFIKTEDNEPSAIISGTLKRYIDILKEFCTLYNANLKYVDNVHFASDNLLQLETGILDNSFILSLYLSNDYLSIDLLQNYKPVRFLAIPLKQSSEIIQFIDTFIKTNELLNGDIKLISRVYISGDSILDSLVSNLENAFDFDVYSINPFNKIKHSPSLKQNNAFYSESNSFASAAGIAFRLIY